MLDFFKVYPLQDIIIFCIMFCLAAKGLVSFVDWARERLKVSFLEENHQQEECNQLKQKLLDYEKQYIKLQKEQKQFQEALEHIIQKMNILIDSDKDDIKAWITEKHHELCYEKHCVDDYTLECIEKRYSHYVNEGGNSFIDTLMSDIRKLNKQSN